MRLKDGVDPLSEVRLRLVTDDALRRFPGAEEDEGRNAQDAELRSGDRIRIYVELGDHHPTLVLGRQLLDQGLQHLAGRAPGCPEVDQDELRRAGDGRFEILIGDLDDILRRHAAPSFVLGFSSVLAGGDGAGGRLPASAPVLAFVSAFVAAFASALVSVLAPSAGAVLPSVAAPRESVL